MKITKKAVLAIMCLSLAAFAPGKAHAANKVQIPDGACRKGNDIYYSYSGSGLRMDLMKINTKTHKKKMIVSNKYKGRTTNGFFDLNIKGNNIYATYNIVDGSDGFNCYICKINVKKKTKKLLTKGHHPIVIGNKIYFVKTKYNKTFYQDQDKGIYVMNLSGKKIRKVHKMSSSSYIYSLGSCGKSLVYEHTDSNQERVYTRLSKQGKRLGDLDPNDTITSTYTSADSSYDCGVDNKSYYVTGGKVLCTDYDTDKTTTLVRYDSDHYGVQSFQVFGDVMVVRGHRQKYIKKYHYMGSKGYIYLIHLKKKPTKVLLKKYICGE